MGDRANVQFVWPETRFDSDVSETPKTIDLYAHWAGGDLAATVVKHLGSDVVRARWNDPPYCCRLIVQRTMNELFDPDNDAGGGLSPYLDDNEHAVLELDMEHQRYSFGQSSGTWEELCALNLSIVRTMAG